jgi:thioredoxin reductase (NADPH)
MRRAARRAAEHRQEMAVAHSKPDLLIVGGGPAGVSAALWAVTLDLRPLVLEAEARTGGQLHRIHFEPRNLPASQPGRGEALAARASAQLDTSGVTVRCNARAAAIERVEGGARLLVRTADGATHEAPAVVIATGLRARRLGIPGEREFEGRGVSDSATRDLDKLRGRDVTVIGGGDAAFENTLLLAGAGCRVTLAVRGPVHARARFVDRVADTPSVEVLHGANAEEILGNDAVRAVRFTSARGTIERATSAVVVKIGQEPRTKWCREALACDADGYIRVDPAFRTSLAGAWAIGDVVRPLVPGIAVALGHGAAAAAAIRNEFPPG